MSKYTNVARDGDRRRIDAYPRERSIALDQVEAAKRKLIAATMTGDDDYDVVWAGEEYRRAMERYAGLVAAYHVACKRLDMKAEV